MREVLAIPRCWYVCFNAEIGIIYQSIYDRPTLNRVILNVTISSFFRTVVINSLNLKNMRSSPSGEFLLAKSWTFLDLNSCLSIVTFCRVFFFVLFVFLTFNKFIDWTNVCKPSIHANVHFHSLWHVAAHQKAGNRYRFSTSEKFRMRPVIGHTIFLTGVYDQSDCSSFWQTIFIWQLCLEKLSVAI